MARVAGWCVRVVHQQGTGKEVAVSFVAKDRTHGDRSLVYNSFLMLRVESMIC